MPFFLPAYRPPGFPVFIDNEATPSRARELCRYLIDGGFFDDRTLTTSVELIAFNPARVTLYYLRVDFMFLASSVEVAADTLSVPVAEHADPRMRRWVGVNAALTLLAAGQLARELYRVRRWAQHPWRWRRKGRYQRAWRFAVFLHVFLQIAAMGLFWGGVLVSALTFDPARDFPIYDDLSNKVLCVYCFFGLQCVLYCFLCVLASTLAGSFRSFARHHAPGSCADWVLVRRNLSPAGSLPLRA